MFLRKCTQRKDSQDYAYWQLVESYRTARGPRQRVVAYLGDLDEAGRIGVKEAASGNSEQVHQGELFDAAEPRWVQVDTSRVKVERTRFFGGAWLGLVEFLESVMAGGREEISWPMMSLVLVLSRLCDPSSELRIAEHLYERSALGDLLAVPVGKVNDDRLYRALDGGWTSVREGLEVKLCACPGGEETLILCRSIERREKEKAMHARFEKRIEAGLEKIAQVCRKYRRQRSVVERRVGKLLGQNSRAAGLFTVDVSEVDGRAQVEWSKVDSWRDWSTLSEGCYMLRSNITDWSADDLWKAYIQLTDAEAAFRIAKSDLSIRPIWHQKKERVQAHILVCFLAYVLWKTLGQMCHRAGLGDEPRKVFDEIAQIQMVDVLLPTSSGLTIRRRCVAQPTKHQAILLQKLGLTLPTHLKAHET